MKSKTEEVSIKIIKATVASKQFYCARIMVVAKRNQSIPNVRDISRRFFIYIIFKNEEYKKEG